jgi:serine protease AprX
LSIVKAATYSIPASALEDLANDPDIAYVSPDRTVNGLLDYAEPTVNALIAFNNNYDGTGIGVAVLDSGIGLHDDLKNSKGATRVIYGQDFASDPGTVDIYGHGQHVAGIIAGNAADSSGSQYTHTFRGIAPNANLLNFRVLDKNGQGTDSSVIAAIQ